MDDGDPALAGQVWVGGQQSTANPHLSGICGQLPADQSDEGRLPGAVLAHQGDDLTGSDLQTHVAYGLRRPERLRRVDDAQDR